MSSSPWNGSARSPQRDKPIVIGAAGRVLDLDEVKPDYERVFSELCHVASLSATQKRPDVVRGLVETVLADAPTGVPAVELGPAVQHRFEMPIPLPEIDEAWRKLVVTQSIANCKDGRLRITARRAAEVLRKSEDAKALEVRVKAQWLAECADRNLTENISPECLWAVLQKYMASAFRQHGVQTIALLTPAQGASGKSDATGLSEALDKACAATGVENTAEVRAAVHDFFVEPGADRAGYLAQLLDSTFTFFALSTPSVAADFLRASLAPLKMFLDTNTLFDLLGLHEDPAATEALILFIQANNLPITLLAHERTVKEFVGTVAGARDHLLSRRWSSGVSKLAISVTYGFEQAFHIINAETAIDPRAFLSRFEHVHELLASHGIQVYRDPEEHDGVDRAVLFNEYKDFLKVIRPGKPEKPYTVLDHDIHVLWAVRAERRPGSNPLTSGALFVTNDTGLFSFEHRRRNRGELPVVTLTSQILQVLRPFGVPTADLNERFIEMFAVPSFRTVYSDYRDTQAHVLGYMAAYDDVPVATAAAIMSNELLLQELGGLDPDDDRFKKHVDDAIILENKRLLEEREDVAVRAAQAEAENAESRAALELAADREAELLLEAEQRQAKFEQDAVVAAEKKLRLEASEVTKEAERKGLEDRVAELEAVSTAALVKHQVLKRRLWQGAVFVGAILLALLTIFGPGRVGWLSLLAEPEKRGLARGLILWVVVTAATALLWRARWEVFAGLAGAGVVGLLIELPK